MKRNKSEPEYRYLNGFYNPDSSHSQREFICRSHPVNYMGYQIFHRVNSRTYQCFDTVKDGVCINQHTNLDYAKKIIDRNLEIAAEKLSRENGK